MFGGGGLSQMCAKASAHLQISDLGRVIQLMMIMMMIMGKAAVAVRKHITDRLSFRKYR